MLVIQNKQFTKSATKAVLQPIIVFLSASALLLAGGLIIEANVKAANVKAHEPHEPIYHKAMHHGSKHGESMHKDSMDEKHMHKKDGMHKHGKKKRKHKAAHHLMGRMSAQFMAGMDMDGNGEISAAEFANSFPNFATLDTDGSGTISASEWHKFTQMRNEKHKAHITKSMDANGDGQISSAEKQAFYKKYGYMMDKDHMRKDHMHKDHMHKDMMHKDKKKSGWSNWGRKQKGSQDAMPQ